MLGGLLGLALVCAAVFFMFGAHRRGQQIVVVTMLLALFSGVLTGIARGLFSSIQGHATVLFLLLGALIIVVIAGARYIEHREKLSRYFPPRPTAQKRRLDLDP